MLAAETIDFIRASIKSVWALELLLLIREQRDRVWKVSEITREMRASDLLVNEILNDFARAFVIETSPGSFQYRAADSKPEK
jgi:hypothetical protein